MRQMLVKLGRVWDTVESAIGGLFLTLSVCIVVVEIIGRNLFSFSIIGADEIASFAVIWSVFFTASIGVKKNIHVRIDVLLMILPATAARLLDCIGTVMALVFTTYLTYSGWTLLQESIMLGEMTMTMLRMPLWIPQSIIPVGGFLLSVRLLQRLLFLLSHWNSDLSGTATATAIDAHGLVQADTESHRTPASSTASPTSTTSTTAAPPT